MAVGSRANSARGPTGGGRHPLVLAPVATAASDARGYVQDTLRQLGLDHLVDAATLAVSELVTNAALHARTEIAVSVVATAHGRIRIEVSDESAVLPRSGGHDLTSSVGRGLKLLTALDAWGVDHVQHQGDRRAAKVVWFELTIEPDARGSSMTQSDGAQRPDPSARDDVVSAPADTTAVLGRYSASEGGRLVTVHLLRVPLQLFAAAQEHHDEVIREFTLLALAPVPPSGQARPLPHRLVKLIELLGRRHWAAGERSDGVRDQAVARGEVVTDLTYRVPASARDSLIGLDRLMEEADEFCRSEQLLTLAAPPLVRQFRRWFTVQFIRQIDGHPPTPWSGPLLPVLSPAQRRSASY